MSHPSRIVAVIGSLLLSAVCASSQTLTETPPAAKPGDAKEGGLPPGALVRLGTARFRHAEAVVGVAFSPDGKRLASADHAGSVRVAAADTGRPVVDLPKGTGTLVLFTPDGKHLICGGEKGLTLRDAETGEVVRTFGDRGQARGRGRGVQATHTVALSLDGKTFAEAAGTEVVLWEVATGNELRRLKGDKGPLGAVTFSHDGKTVVAGDDSTKTTLLFWDAKTGEEAHRIAEVHAEGRGNWSTALAFSPDGKHFASASPYELTLWDAATRKPLAKFQTGSPSLAFSPDGKLLAAPRYGGGDDKGTIYVYDVATQKPAHTLRGHVTIVNCVAFAPDGKTVATGGQEGTVRLWDAATGNERATAAAHQAEINSVAFSRDGTSVATASGGDHTVRVWGAASGAPLARLEIPCRFTSHWCPTSHGYNLVFGPDGKTVACDDKVFDIAGGRVLAELPGRALAHSADGKFVAGFPPDRSAVREASVTVWERATGREVGTFRPLGKEASFDASVTAAGLSPDGRVLAVGVDDRGRPDRDKVTESVYLYQVGTGKLLHKFRLERGGPRSLLFSPDGRLLAVAALWDDPVQLWRVADGGLHAQLAGEEQRLHWSEYRPVAFSPDGKLLAAGGKDNSVVVWDALSGKPVHRLTGHQKPVRALAISPDGRRLLSGAGDTQGILWTLAPPAPKADLTAKDLRRLWDELGGDDPAAAYRAAWTLAAAPDPALALFKERLKPLPAPDPARVPRLLADLDSGEFGVRQAAFKELQSFGPAIETALRKTLDGKPSVEVRKSVELLLSELHQQPVPPEELRQLRAVQALEWMEAPGAADLLEVLARGAAVLRPTGDAEAALRRLKGRRGAAEEKRPPAPRPQPSPPAASRKLSELNAEVTSLAFTADGKRLAVAAADGTVLLLDLAGGRELRKFKADDRAVLSAAFSPDGTVLATAGADHTVRLWDGKTGDAGKVLKGHAGAVTAVAFAPDGKLLASGSLDGTVRLWDPAAGEDVRTLKGHVGRVTSVAFSPDGKTLASGDSDERVNKVAGVPFTIYRPEAVRLWDVASGRELGAVPQGGHLVAFSPDGKHLATADLATELLVGGEGGILIRGKNSVVGGGQGEATIRGGVAITLRDRATGQPRWHLAGKGTALAFSPDGGFLATARGTDLHQGGKVLDTPGAVPHDGRLRLWEVASGQEVLAFPDAALPAVLAFAPDGCSLAAGAKDGGVTLWDLRPKARDDADPDRLWKVLAGEDAAAAYRAAWSLRGGNAKALRFLSERLRPSAADDPRLCRLIADLGAEKFEAREAAAAELERLGADAEPALCAALPRSASPELRHRILALLAAPGVSQYPDALARARAIAVLEGVGSAEARQVLEVLAKGPPLAEQTREARAALERLSRR
jgi:WD40 repeat protein